MCGHHYLQVIKLVSPCQVSFCSLNNLSTAWTSWAVNWKSWGGGEFKIQEEGLQTESGTDL